MTKDVGPGFNSRSPQQNGVEQQKVHTMQANLSQVVCHWGRLIIEFKIIFLIRWPAYRLSEEKSVPAEVKWLSFSIDILQEDLDALIEWSNDWKMEFNIPKCNVMQVTTNQNVTPFSYKMCNMPLSIVQEHGIRLHHKLSWTPQINHNCSKANRLLGFLKRNLYHAPQHTKEHVYKQLLLPLIEYCSVLWDPYHQSDVSKLEMIQHRSARFILNTECNKHASLPTMVYFRIPKENCSSPATF